MPVKERLDLQVRCSWFFLSEVKDYMRLEIGFLASPARSSEPLKRGWKNPEVPPRPTPLPAPAIIGGRLQGTGYRSTRHFGLLEHFQRWCLPRFFEPRLI